MLETETRNSFTTSNFVPLENFVAPDEGGRFIPDFNLKHTLVLARPVDPILPHTDSYTEHLARVATLQRFFDSSLGIKSDGKIKNYNPVLERASYEALQTDEERTQFRNVYGIAQIEKALGERFNVATSCVIYDFDENGKLRSRDLPNQAFEDVLETGIEYYRQLNSSDVSRMEKEKLGFLKIQEAFAGPYPKELRAEVISAPGLVEGTIFIDNFVDSYELLEDPLTRQRYVQMVRFTSDANYDQYEERVSAVKPDYFENRQGPKDELFLSNPIFGGEGNFLIQRETSLKEENFLKIIKEGSHRMRYLVETICEEVFQPEKIVLALNTVLNGADYAWAKIVKIKDKAIDFITRLAEKIVPVFRSMREEVDWLGRQLVRVVAGGCGDSAGYSLGGVAGRITEGINGVIGAISGLFKDKDYCINCGACGALIKCVVRKGQKCPKCPAIREC